MPKRDKKAEEDIHEGIKQTKNAIKAFRHYLEFLESGKGLPKAGEARDGQKASYANLIAARRNRRASLPLQRQRRHVTQNRLRIERAVGINLPHPSLRVDQKHLQHVVVDRRIFR